MAEALLVARMPVYYIDHNIYIVKYVHNESLWLRCSKAVDERYSTADGSPPPICLGLCALERR